MQIMVIDRPSDTLCCGMTDKVLHFILGSGAGFSHARVVNNRYRLNCGTLIFLMFNCKISMKSKKIPAILISVLASAIIITGCLTAEQQISGHWQNYNTAMKHADITTAIAELNAIYTLDTSSQSTLDTLFRLYYAVGNHLSTYNVGKQIRSKELLHKKFLAESCLKMGRIEEAKNWMVNIEDTDSIGLNNQYEVQTGQHALQRTRNSRRRWPCLARSWKTRIALEIVLRELPATVLSCRMFPIMRPAIISPDMFSWRWMIMRLPPIISTRRCVSYRISSWQRITWRRWKGKRPSSSGKGSKFNEMFKARGAPCGRHSLD